MKKSMVSDDWRSREIDHWVKRAHRRALSRTPIKFQAIEQRIEKYFEAIKLPKGVTSKIYIEFIHEALRSHPSLVVNPELEAYSVCEVCEHGSTSSTYPVGGDDWRSHAIEMWVDRVHRQASTKNPLTFQQLFEEVNKMSKAGTLPQGITAKMYKKNCLFIAM